MRNELSKPQSLRTRPSKPGQRLARRRNVVPLPADAVDAAFAEGITLKSSDNGSDEGTLSYADVVTKVNQQLQQLETQRVQLQRMLRKAGELR